MTTYMYTIIQKIIGSTFLFLFFTMNLVAQSTIDISLSEAKSKAQKNNIKLKIFQQDYAIAKAKFEQSSAVLLPNINLSNTSSFTNNPLNAFGFKLLQQSVTVPDFNPDFLNHPGQVKNFNTKIELIQPIINIDGWKERKAAGFQLEMANLQLERTADYIQLEVIKTFMNLQLAYKSIDVINKAWETAIENRKLAKNSLSQGLIQNADYLNVEVRVIEIQNQLRFAKSDVKNISDYLSFLMGQNSGNLLKPEKELALERVDFDKDIQLNMERNDIKAIQFGVKAQEQMLEASKNRFIPRANAFANLEWNDDEFLGFGSNNYMLGLQLSWDIFKGYKNIGKIHQEKAQLEKANLNKNNYIAQSELELNKAKRQLTDVKNNLNLTKIAMNQSKEALRIKTNRFEQGLEKTSEILYVESQYQEKELDYYRAIFNFNYTLAYLNYLTK